MTNADFGNIYIAATRLAGKPIDELWAICREEDITPIKGATVRDADTGRIIPGTHNSWSLAYSIAAARAGRVT